MIFAYITFLAPSAQLRCVGRCPFPCSYPLPLRFPSRAGATIIHHTPYCPSYCVLSFRLNGADPEFNWNCWWESPAQLSVADSRSTGWSIDVAWSVCQPSILRMLICPEVRNADSSRWRTRAHGMRSGPGGDTVPRMRQEARTALFRVTGERDMHPRRRRRRPARADRDRLVVRPSAPGHGTCCGHRHLVLIDSDLVGEAVLANVIDEGSRTQRPPSVERCRQPGETRSWLSPRGDFDAG